MKKAKFIFFLSCLVMALALPVPSKGSPIFLDGKSQASWAEPIAIEGVPNLYSFGAGLYRGAQPKPNGFKKLEELGVKTIINLRSFHSEKEEVLGLGISYQQIYMKAWHAEKEDVVQFLRIVANSRRLPIFVHCHHGSDRTGFMVAAYRVVLTGWTKEQAIREMVEGGYGFHPIWANLIHYILNLDVIAIQKEAGVMSQIPGTFAPMLNISPASNQN